MHNTQQAKTISVTFIYRTLSSPKIAKLDRDKSLSLFVLNAALEIYLNYFFRMYIILV